MRTLSALTLFVASFIASVLPARATDSLCARVVLQIDQQLTLERQGFVATLGIANGLPSSLDNFQVTLHVTDANGAPVAVSTDSAPNAAGLFYYRVQDGFTVPSSVPAGTNQNAAFFIVPAPGAAGSTADGALYNIGATITYATAGSAQTVEVAPASITVEPMPQLQLQYFLPGAVYGDDPFTTAIEPVVPFALGVRVINHSQFATAHQVSIDSGQPQIIDNKNGLLVDFKLLSCRVNNQPTQPTLLVNFGDVAPLRASVASWQMTSSLSGQFVKFTAEVSHAPDFGGALTSLIPDTAISTHRLIGQVLVDLPGRDTVPDFLACEAMSGDISAPSVYESDSDQVSEAVDYFAPGNSAVSLNASGSTATLAVNSVSTMLFVRAASPIAADQNVTAVRSDGKPLPARNVWVSKTEDSSGNWSYWLNLFDTSTQSGQTYALTFSNPPPPPGPPVVTIKAGASFKIGANRLFTLAVSATSPDGSIPALSTGALPDGASFVDGGSGTGTLTWTPTLAQLGTYPVEFRATNAVGTTSKSVTVQVLAHVGPTFSSWQQDHWPNITDPAVIGPNADPDGDGIPNLVEYALGADPTKADDTVLPQLGVETVNGQRYLTLTFQQRTDDPGLVYEVVGSNDPTLPLANWTVQTQTETANQDSLPSGFMRVTVRDSIPIDSGPPQRYLRLRVTDNDTP